MATTRVATTMITVEYANCIIVVATLVVAISPYRFLVRLKPFYMKYSRYLAMCILGSTLFLFTACSSQNNIVNPSPGTWRIVHSMNPGRAQNNLSAVAATSANNTSLSGAGLVPHSTSIWAVGTGATYGAEVNVSSPNATQTTYVTPVTAETLIETCCS